MWIRIRYFIICGSGSCSSSKIRYVNLRPLINYNPQGSGLHVLFCIAYMPPLWAYSRPSAAPFKPLKLPDFDCNVDPDPAFYSYENPYQFPKTMDLQPYTDNFLAIAPRISKATVTANDLPNDRSFDGYTGSLDGPLLNRRRSRCFRRLFRFVIFASRRLHVGGTRPHPRLTATRPHHSIYL